MYYSVSELSDFPGFSQPTGQALNDKGDVAGYVYQTAISGNTSSYGAIWHADISTKLLPVASELSGINDEGIAVGAAWGTQPADPYQRAILVSHDNEVDLESIAGPESAAHCINYVSNGGSLACVTTGQGDLLAIDVDSAMPTVKFQLAAGPGASLRATTINENSEIAGWNFFAADATSFLYKDGIMMSDTPENGSILALNNSGKGGGYYQEPGQPFVPAIWDTSSSTPNPLQVPLPAGCDHGSVFGINDSGWAVGYCFSSGNHDEWRPFVYDGSNTTDLNTLINAPGWILQSANAINNSGQIVATGTLNGAATSFLLTPVSLDLRGRATQFLLWAMLFGGIANDGGGLSLVGGRSPRPVGPWVESILSPAAQDVVVGLAVDAVARQLGDQVGAEAIRKAAVEMTSRAVSRLMTPTVSAASQSTARRRDAVRSARPRGRFLVPASRVPKHPRG